MSIKKIKTDTEGTPEAANKTVIYCGPDIPGIAQTYAVFRNGLPKQLEELMKDIPEIGQLLVKPEKLTSVKRNVGIKGTAENLFYGKIVNARKGRR